ncbi:retroviral-like aspartic protease family protein [Azospirillum sp. B4]|uniref:retroviral-like aspartic protease family protein n=1 Tax=Azospirillum sp. B4 TaxID=95605 RepID=UPI00034947BE|nr:retroviral-like aspartic protease family protein [Azospirillum sp. B4]
MMGKRAARLGGLALMGLAQMAMPAGATTQCQFGIVASLPVTMSGNQPLVEGSINGQRVRFLVDTGSFASLLFRDAAEKLGLRLTALSGATVYGVGGESSVMVTSVDSLTLDKSSMKNLRLIVTGQGKTADQPVTVAGVLGEDMLRQFDVEMDLSHGQINFHLSRGDCDDVDLIPWEGAYTVADFPKIGATVQHIRPEVKVNGQPVRAELDSGAYYSILTKQDAGRLGVRPDSPGVVQAGTAGGIGAHEEPVWIGTFDSFTIGDETIHHPKMRFGDIFKHGTVTPVGSHIPTQVIETEMLLGADFLRSHHVLIAHSQGRLYVSYVGGTVFQTDTPVAGATAAQPPSPSP